MNRLFPIQFSPPATSDLDAQPAETGPFDRWLKLAEELLDRDPVRHKENTSTQGSSPSN